MVASSTPSAAVRTQPCVKVSFLLPSLLLPHISSYSHSPLTTFKTLELNAALAPKGFAIVDGGLASELERRGFDLNDKLWSAKVLVENSSAIAEVHKAYLCSGADIITTSSYQATIQGLAARGFEKSAAADILRMSVEIAVSTRDLFWEGLDDIAKSKRVKPLVAASVGSYGAYLANGAEYTGLYDIGLHELMAFHRDRVSILASSGADLIAFETIPSLEEGRAIVELLEELPEVAAWLSFSCKDDEHCSHGEKFEECVKMANSSEKIVAIGVNCTNPKYMSGLIRAAKAASKVPIIVYPNRGEEWDHVYKKWLPCDDQPAFSDMALQWIEEGCQIVGGCCRTTPEDISEIFVKTRRINKKEIE